MFFTEYSEAELKNIVDNQIEENLHLDYKQAKALEKSDKQNEKVTKTVSAFANSDGGMIIYGIKEFQEESKKHLPEKIDAIDRRVCSRERLEQIINSIQPRLPNVRITPIALQSSETDVAYVVEISKSDTAHQASDFRYYRRFNFQSVPMYDYEVKDLINRQQMPVLKLVLKPSQTTFIGERIRFPLVVENRSLKMARDVKLTIEITAPAECNNVKAYEMNDLSGLNPGIVFGSKNDLSVYYGLAMVVGDISFQPAMGSSKFSFRTTIYADKIAPVVNHFSIVLNANGALAYEAVDKSTGERLIDAIGSLKNRLWD
jgi:hypothetical protein